MLAEHRIVFDERDDELWALCPNPDHDDHNPSWSINVESGLHRCFACGYAGRVEQLIADLEGHGDWRSIVDRAGTYLVTGSPVQPAVAGPVVETTDPALLASFSDPPLDALERRRVTLGSCEAYRVRYDEGRWVLPVFTDDGLLGWQYKVDEHGGAVWNYPKGMRMRGSLFGFGVANPSHVTLVVESPLDAVRLHSMGYDAVATWGAGVSVEQMAMIALHPRILLAFDNDPAGDRAVERCIDHLADRVRSLQIFFYGEITAKDVGDMTDDEIATGVEDSYHAAFW